MEMEYTLLLTLPTPVDMHSKDHLDTIICTWLEYLLVNLHKGIKVTEHHHQKQEHTIQLMRMIQL